MNSKWSGIYCALWTPTDANGELIISAVRLHLAFLKRAGLHGLLALGSTGEFLHLEVAARCRFLEEVARSADGLRLIANVSDIRPKVVAELCRCAKQIGAHAISILPPYFFPVAQSDLVEFFLRAAEAAQLPLMLYNFPDRTGNRIAPESIETIANRVPVAAVKQSGAEFSYHTTLVELGRRHGFDVLTGTDTRLADAFRLGVTGCVSGLSNAVPEPLLQIFSAWQKGQPDSAITAERQMTALGQLVDQLEFPLNVAAVIEARGFNPGAPKSIVSTDTERRYRRLVEQAKAFLAEAE